MTRKFSIHGFKNWLMSQKDVANFFSVEHAGPAEGMLVFPNRPLRRLLESAVCDGNPKRALRLFKEYGGKIIATEGDEVSLELHDGSILRLSADGITE